jgi:hypothetical protein
LYGNVSLGEEEEEEEDEEEEEFKNPHHLWLEATILG